MGSKEITQSGDGMGIKTFDNSLSAHFEHTLALTEKGVMVLTEL
jgi:methionine aminopeptidase